MKRFLKSGKIKKSREDVSGYVFFEYGSTEAGERHYGCAGTCEGGCTGGCSDSCFGGCTGCGTFGCY